MATPDYQDDPDVKLMLAFQRGDSKAFEELMTRNYKRVLNFVYRYLNNRQLAEDITQDVFIKIYQNVKSYKPASKFQTWAFTIARNLSLNELRRHKTVSMSSTIETDDGDIKHQFADTKAASPAEALLDEEKSKIILRAIGELPESQRAAVLLRRYEDFSYEEIAQSLNISVQAVKSLLNRAKENLKEKLAALFDET